MPASPKTLTLILSRIRPIDTGFILDGEPSKCWEWQGALDTSGYGVVKVKGRQVPVHHIVKQPPPTMEVDHLCRIRNCVNPKHLEIVSQKENKRRANAIRFGKV